MNFQTNQPHEETVLYLYYNNKYSRISDSSEETFTLRKTIELSSNHQEINKVLDDFLSL